MPSVCKKHTCEVHKTRCACPPLTFDCVTLGVTGAEPLPANQTDITSGAGWAPAHRRTRAWSVEPHVDITEDAPLFSITCGRFVLSSKGVLESILPTYF